MTVLDLDSVTSKIVVWKLGFLKRQLAVGVVGVAAVVMKSLLDDPNSLCLVRECPISVYVHNLMFVFCLGYSETSLGAVVILPLTYSGLLQLTFSDLKQVILD